MDDMTLVAVLVGSFTAGLALGGFAGLGWGYAAGLRAPERKRPGT